jgi:hypothetical protein
MPKSARRYDVYLPLTDNDGVLFPGEKFTAVENVLIERFGGLTSQRREFAFRGTWREGTKVYSDRVIVLTAIDFRRGGSTRFVTQLKADVLREFQQLEILITKPPLRVH